MQKVATHAGLSVMTENMEEHSSSFREGNINTEPCRKNGSNEEHTLGSILGQRISKTHAEYLLLTCSFIAGLADSGCFNTWSCFVNMQTGTSLNYLSTSKIEFYLTFNGCNPQETRYFSLSVYHICPPTNPTAGFGL